MDLTTEENTPVGQKLRFTNCRKPAAVSELTEIEQQQLVMAGKLYHGEELPAAVLLGTSGEEVDEELTFAGFLSVWDAVDEQGVVRYTAWLYMVDSGTIFAHESTEVVAEVIQCGLECDDDTLAQQLEDAAREARSQDEEARADISISTR
jgi:hypothetical protein